MKNCEDIESLKKNINGIIVTNESNNYDKIRLNWNPYSTHYPYCIVHPVSEKDIIHSIEWCKKHNIKFRVRGNRSHSLGYDFSNVTNGLVCNVKNFNSIRYEPDKIIVGAGIIIGDLVYNLAQEGYMFPFGDSYNVGIGGIIQGGGIGLQNKQMGLCCDNLLGCKIVTSDCQILEVNDEQNSDLLWALKGGGGGNFGVITEMTLKYISAPETVIHINMEWKHVDLDIVREIIIEWMNTNQYDNENICRNLNVSKVTGSKLFNAHIGCMIYNDDESLFRFKKIGIFVKTVSVMSYYDAVQADLEVSRNDTHSDLNIKFLGYFTDKILDKTSVDMIVKYFNENDSDLFFLELGGKFSKNSDDSAFYWRNSIMYFELSIIWPVRKYDTLIYRKRGKHTSKTSLDIRSGQNSIHEQMYELGNYPDFSNYNKVANELNKKYKAGYVNVPNSTYKTPDKYQKAYYGDNAKKLIEIKKKYDKNNFFNFSQSIRE
jgi:hypothetical protein